MNETRISKLKHTISIAYVAYHDGIRKFTLRALIILNFILFCSAFLSNMPSMVVYALNIFYIYKFMIEKYPEISLKRKDRYRDKI
jgi:hypothetical protein